VEKLLYGIWRDPPFSSRHPRSIVNLAGPHHKRGTALAGMRRPGSPRKSV